jgi:heme/copper-type cytochrome/quinol oxidase subunit 2
MNLLLACAVCFGASDSPQTQAQNAGIFVLLGVTGLVLVGFVALGIYFVRRARRYQAAQEIISQIPEGLPQIG